MRTFTDMRQTFARPAALAAPAAALLALIVASQALALTWSAPVALTTSGGAYTSPGLVGLGSSRFVAVFDDVDKIQIRRSTDSGLTWKSAQTLSTNGREPAITGRSASIDVVWVQNSRVRYAHSSDYGSTFAASVALSPLGPAVESPAVARGPNGLVVAAWLQAATVPCCDGPWNVKVRVSHDGGVSFGTLKDVGTGWNPAVGAGDGVAYVAWNGLDFERGQPHLRRSVDAGATWSAAVKLPRVSIGLNEVHPSIAASGAVAYVAYDVWQAPADPDGIGNQWIKYVASSDRGATWSAGRNLTGTTSGTGGPVLSLKNGVLRATFGKADGVAYKQSSDGTTWTSAVTVAGFGQPHGVAVAGRVGVLYTSGELFTDVWVRTAAP